MHGYSELKSYLYDKTAMGMPELILLSSCFVIGNFALVMAIASVLIDYSASR